MIELHKELQFISLAGLERAILLLRQQGANAPFSR